MSPDLLRRSGNQSNFSNFGNLCSLLILWFDFYVWFYLKVVNVPSFVVRLDSQKHIDFSLKSPFGGGRAGRVKRKNAKKGSGGGGDEDED